MVTTWESGVYHLLPTTYVYSLYLYVFYILTKNV